MLILDGAPVPARDHTVAGRSEIPLALEQGQEPLPVVITAGRWGDPPRSEPVLERSGCRCGRMTVMSAPTDAAHGSYSGRKWMTACS